MREKGKPPVKPLSATTLGHARALRRDHTDAEKKLWLLLHSRRLNGAKFRRQHPIGSYIVDFCCIKGRLVIELDGDQHGEEAHMRKDLVRTTYLESQGFSVMRFWNHEVLKEPEQTLERIYEVLVARVPNAEPSP